MIKRLLLIFAVALFAAAPMFAQTAAPPKTPAATGTAAQGGKTKIAILSFLALRELVGELKAKYEKLEVEFRPRQIALDSLQGTIASQEKTLAENTSLTPAQSRKLSEDIEAKKREYQRSVEDAQELARKREGEETAAVLEKINTFLEKYCEQRGITHVFDVGRLQETGTALYVAPSANITEDFIAEYNKANPMPAGTAPATPKKP